MYFFGMRVFIYVFYTLHIYNIYLEFSNVLHAIKDIMLQIEFFLLDFDGFYSSKSVKITYHLDLPDSLRKNSLCEARRCSLLTLSGYRRLTTRCMTAKGPPGVRNHVSGLVDTCPLCMSFGKQRSCHSRI